VARGRRNSSGGPLMHPWNEPLLESLKRRAGRRSRAADSWCAGVGNWRSPKDRPSSFFGKPRTRRASLRRLPKAAAGTRGTIPTSAASSRKPWPRSPTPRRRRRRRGDGSRAPQQAEPRDQDRSGARAGRFLNIGSHRAGLRVALVHPAEEMNVKRRTAFVKRSKSRPARYSFSCRTVRPPFTDDPQPLRCRCRWPSRPGRRRCGGFPRRDGDADAGSPCGGAPLRALDYAGQGGGHRAHVARPRTGRDRTRSSCSPRALQKSALDRAFAALCAEAKLPHRRPTGASRTAHLARLWRQLGKDGRLCRHPLSPKLFSAYLIASMPDDVTSQ